MCRPETLTGSGRMFHSYARWMCCQHPLADTLCFVGFTLLCGLFCQQHGQGMPGEGVWTGAETPVPVGLKNYKQLKSTVLTEPLTRQLECNRFW